MSVPLVRAENVSRSFRGRGGWLKRSEIKAVREVDLTAQQKADLLSFIHDDGKGFVGAHSAIDAFYSWPGYGEMIGAYFDNHPWGVMDAPVLRQAL